VRIAAVALCLGGCSFVLVSGPPPNPAREPSFDCTETIAVPVIDTIPAVFFDGFTALALIGLASTYNSPGSHDGAVIAGLAAIPAGLLGIAYTVSAARGYSDVDACRDAKSAAASQARKELPSRGGM
jgi:hypothetical protein